VINFGNREFILYIAIATLSLIVLELFYLYWKKKSIERIFSFNQGIANFFRGSIFRSRIKLFIIIVSIFLFAFILLRPQWGDVVKEVNSEGSDVLIALDVSRSMLATDVDPSRLQKAKESIKWIAQSLQGDRIGLILFAGDAFLQCPFTNDLDAFMMFLDAASPKDIRMQGTDMGRMFAVAAKTFKQKRLTSKLLIVITDGEDNEGKAMATASLFNELGVSIYTVGVGKDGSSTIPLSEDDDSGDIYLRDSSGHLVNTRKDSGLLKKIAGATGGAYIDITNGFSGLRFILQIISDQKKNNYGTKIIREPKEQYQIFAIILIFLLLIEQVIAERDSEGKKFFSNFISRFKFLKKKKV